MSQPRLLWDTLYTLAEKGPISKRQVSMEQGQFCRIPDVLTFEQGHFLHALPRASILPCPPLWHPACRAPDVLTFEQGHFFCMGCHGPPFCSVHHCGTLHAGHLMPWHLSKDIFFAWVATGLLENIIYICWLHFMLYIFNVFYNVYIYIDVYIFWLWHSTVGKYLLDILVRCIQCLTWPLRQHHAETDWWAQKNGKNESQLGLAGLLQVTG